MDAQDKQRVKDKNKKVKDALKAQGKDTGTFSVMTRWGEVHFEGINTVTDADGVEFLDIRLAGQPASGDPHYRLYNPPTLVDDPQGPIQGKRPGRKLREDPVLAVAEAIARQGGRQKGRKP